MSVSYTHLELPAQLFQRLLFNPADIGAGNFQLLRHLPLGQGLTVGKSVPKLYDLSLIHISKIENPDGVNNIDEIIKLIKSSKDANEAREALIERFGLDVYKRQHQCSSAFLLGR